MSGEWAEGLSQTGTGAVLALARPGGAQAPLVSIQERGRPPTPSLTVPNPKNHPFLVASEITCGRKSQKAGLDIRCGYVGCVRCFRRECGRSRARQLGDTSGHRPLLASMGPGHLLCRPFLLGQQDRGLKARMAQPTCHGWPQPHEALSGEGGGSERLLSKGFPEHLWRVWQNSLCPGAYGTFQSLPVGGIFV